MTPMVPAMTRKSRLLVNAKAKPAAAMRIEPTINMRRRPIRSALVVR
jgi:hypothetical protein